MVDKVRKVKEPLVIEEPEAQEEAPKPRTMPAGYNLVLGENVVLDGFYQGEKAVLCDARFGTESPAVYRLTGVPMTKESAECLRTVWGLGEDSLVLDAYVKHQGTYCIEKMDASSYNVLLNDERFEEWRGCVGDKQEEKIEAALTIDEPSKIGEFAFLSLAFGGGATAVSMLLTGLFKLAKGWWNNRKPPAPPASGGGGEDFPVLVDRPASADSPQFSKYEPEVRPESFGDEFDPDAVYEYKTVPLGDAAKSMADKLGLIAVGIMGAVLMYFAPSVGLTLQGSTAGGAFIVGPGADKNNGMVFGGYTGPVA